MNAASYPVHTLAELETWPVEPPSFAVIGCPAAHSLSPAMHNPALAELAKHDATFATWRYHKFEVPPDSLADALHQFHERGFFGLNVTVPHKEGALALAESADAFALAAGAANTLIRTATGWRATNTDSIGLAEALRTDLGLSLTGAHVILLGAGGAARAAAVQCLRDHAASLSIGNRGTERLKGLLSDLVPLAGHIPMRGFLLDAPPADLPPGAIVINATSVGLNKDAAAPIDLTKLPAPAHVFDMIYRPAETTLLRQAAALGIPHTNGLSMLVRQGAHSLSLWTGMEAPIGVMERAVRAALAS